MESAAETGIERFSTWISAWDLVRGNSAMCCVFALQPLILIRQQQQTAVV